MKCPICSRKHTMTACTYILQAHPVDNINIPVELEAFECSNCGEQIETHDLVKINSVKVAKAKLAWLSMRNDKNNIANIIRELRKSTGLTQQEFSALTGATGTAISKYELGTVKPSALAEKFFLLMARKPETLDILSEMGAAERVQAHRVLEPDFSVIAWMDSASFVDSKRPSSAPIFQNIYALKEPERDDFYSICESFAFSAGTKEPLAQPAHPITTKSGHSFFQSIAVH